MAERSRGEEQNGFKSILDELPVDRLKSELQEALSVAAERTAEAAGDKISGLTDRLVDMAAGGGIAGKAMAGGGKAAATGGSPLLGALKGGVMGAKDKAAEMLSGGSGGSGGKQNPLKATTIIESIDVGVPIDVAYNQWTQFQDFSGFMKKVERVEQKTDEKLDFKAKILWSHRTWEATILEQVPDEKIVWRSKGEKGHVDGTVTFHELAPNLTRVLVVLEYYPQGLFERVGNIWRAQGRRARVELKHFQRHVMTDVILHPDEVEGWRGEIHQGRAEAGSEEDAEEEDVDEEAAEDEPEDEYDEEPEDEYDEDEEPGAEDEYEDEDEEEPESEEVPDEETEDEPVDEYDEEDEEPEADAEYEDEGDEDEPADEYDEEDEEPEADDEYEDEEEPVDEYDEEDEDTEYEDEGDEDLPADEYDDEEDEESEADDEYDEGAEDEEEPVDEYDEDDEYEDDEELPEDEDDYEEEPEQRPRRRAS